MNVFGAVSVMVESVKHEVCRKIKRACTSAVVGDAAAMWAFVVVDRLEFDGRVRLKSTGRLNFWLLLLWLLWKVRL